MTVFNRPSFENVVSANALQGIDDETTRTARFTQVAQSKNVIFKVQSSRRTSLADWTTRTSWFPPVVRVDSARTFRAFGFGF